MSYIVLMSNSISDRYFKIFSNKEEAKDYVKLMDGLYKRVVIAQLTEKVAI